MSDGAGRGHVPQRDPAAVEVRVAAELGNLALLRTLVGAVGTYFDLDFDAVADLRLAVDEACTRLIRAATPDATLTVVVDPRVDAVVVEVSTTCATDDIVAEGSFSWHVLSSLTDDVRMFHNGDRAGSQAGLPADHLLGSDGRVVGISLTTRRAGTSR